LKELLPSATWSSSSARADMPISLNTNDPVYVTYFTKVKQLIESQWEYPEIALRYGLQGRLALQFMIGGNGQLEQLRLIRSSGSQVLDEEAVRRSLDRPGDKGCGAFPADSALDQAQSAAHLRFNGVPRQPGQLSFLAVKSPSRCVAACEKLGGPILPFDRS
jgi:hypothetical protein